MTSSWPISRESTNRWTGFSWPKLTAGPQWSRVEWAQKLLLHAYTHSSTKHSAPILTAIAFVNWWEGHGSKAHQFLQLALEADPAYRLARLSDLVIGSGMVAGWNMDKDRAFRPWGLVGTQL